MNLLSDQSERDDMFWTKRRLLSQPRLVMQLHVTGQCNLHCKHCYRESERPGCLSTEDIFDLFLQFEALHQAFNQTYGSTRPGQINLTGGETFLREDMLELIACLGAMRKSVRFSVLTNGTLLGAKEIRALKAAKVSFVQLSLDGCQARHDDLRAPGDYARTLRKAADLEQHGIRTYISFTANRENLAELPQVARACREQRISCLWSDRLVPMGRGKEMEALAIGANTLPDYLASLRRAKGSVWEQLRFPHTEVRMNRALQCLGGGQPYRCGAGSSLIVVDEYGTILPCRRMPIPCGTIYDTTLQEAYWLHPIFQALREPFQPEGCTSCTHWAQCFGGARCQSYALYGDYRHADPACPLQHFT